MEASTIKVLLIDDEAALLDLSKQFLELNKDIFVDTTTSAIDALKRIELKDYDVIVSDYQMPEKDGIQLLKEIRTRGNNVPFILFTGKGREKVAIEALNSGADYYLQKGVDITPQFAELASMINQAYSRKKAEDSLRLSEERYRSLFENSIDGVMLIALDGSILSANPSACRMFGMRKDELVEIGLETLVLQDGMHGMSNLMWEQIDFAGGIFTFKRKDGTTFIGEATSGLFTDQHGGARISMIIRDTTETTKNAEELIASEKRYRRLFETAQDGILIIDLKSETVIDANKYLLKLTGYTLNATLDKHLWELGFIEDKLLAENAFLELRTNGYVRYENIPLRRMDGETVPVEFISNVYGVNGTSIVQCNIRDISERRSGFQREIEMTRIIDSTSDAVIGKNLNGIVTSWNKGAEKIYGYTKDEIIGKSISLLAPSDSTNEIQEILAKISRGEMIDNYETTRLTKNGRTIEVSLRISPVLDDRGRIIGAATIASDVSKRKLVEEKLGISEQRYRRLFETAQDGILILDGVTGKVIDANPFILEMTEYKLNELVGKQLWELGFIRDQKQSRTAFARLKKDGYIRYEDIPLRKKNGTVFDVEFVSNEYQVNGTKVIQCNIRDITDRKLIKDALLQTNRKLNLLSNITRHDINNQLMTLEGNLTLLDREQFDKDSIDHLQKADAAAKRISSMIQFTKEYENIGVKAPIWHKVRDLIENASKGVALGPIKLANDIPGDLEVFADPLITKVFYNMIDNAVRHGGKITTIRFYIEEHDGARYMICEDDGVGIPSDMKDKLFTHNQGKDHGFGLFLSQEILLITDIVIKEDGVPGKGARFRITVPGSAWHSRCLNVIHQRPDCPFSHQLIKMERFDLSIVPANPL